jgi:hypothetical protein
MSAHYSGDPIEPKTTLEHFRRRAGHHPVRLGLVALAVGRRSDLMHSVTFPLLPRQVLLFVAMYFAASLVHFSHNAEYIAHYPNMPSWLTREKVYIAWLAVTGVGLSGLLLLCLGRKVVGALCLLGYGALGLGGLGHYSLALCSEHTVAMNVTIWAEAVAGVGLAICCGAVVAGAAECRFGAKSDA